MTTKPENNQDVIYICQLGHISRNNQMCDNKMYSLKTGDYEGCNTHVDAYAPKAQLDETQNELTKALRRIGELQTQNEIFRSEFEYIKKYLTLHCNIHNNCDLCEVYLIAEKSSQK